MTRTFLRKAEGVDFAKKKLEPGFVMSADEIAHWVLLSGIFDLKRVNHSEAYGDNDVHTNLAEILFSRLHRIIRGQHYAVSPNHLGAYAGHAAWLENRAAESNGAVVDRLVGDALGAPVSRP